MNTTKLALNATDLALSKEAFLDKLALDASDDGDIRPLSAREMANLRGGTMREYGLCIWMNYNNIHTDGTHSDRYAASSASCEMFMDY